MKKNKLLNKQIIIKRIFFIVLVIVFLALLTGIVINSIQQNGLESFFRISIFETLIIIINGGMILAFFLLSFPTNKSMEYTTTNNIDNKKKYLIDLFDELNVNLKFSFSERPVEAKEVIDKIQRVRMQIESAIETMKYSPKPNFIKVSDNFVKIYNTFHKSLEELILSFHRDLQEERKIELKNDVVMMIDRIKTIIIFEDD